LIVPIDRISSLSPGQPSMPIASIAATPIGLFAQTPPSTSSIADSVMCGLRNVGAAANEPEQSRPRWERHYLAATALADALAERGPRVHQFATLRNRRERPAKARGPSGQVLDLAMRLPAISAKALIRSSERPTRKAGFVLQPLTPVTPAAYPALEIGINRGALLRYFTNPSQYDPNKSTLLTWLCNGARYNAFSQLRDHGRRLSGIEKLGQAVRIGLVGPDNEQDHRLRHRRIKRARNPHPPPGRRLDVDRSRGRQRSHCWSHAPHPTADLRSAHPALT